MVKVSLFFFLILLGFFRIVEPFNSIPCIQNYCPDCGVRTPILLSKLGQVEACGSKIDRAHPIIHPVPVVFILVGIGLPVFC